MNRFGGTVIFVELIRRHILQERGGCGHDSPLFRARRQRRELAGKRLLRHRLRSGVINRFRHLLRHGSRRRRNGAWRRCCWRRRRNGSWRRFRCGCRCGLRNCYGIRRFFFSRGRGRNGSRLRGGRLNRNGGSALLDNDLRRRKIHICGNCVQRSQLAVLPDIVQTRNQVVHLYRVRHAHGFEEQCFNENLFVDRFAQEESCA